MELAEAFIQFTADTKPFDTAVDGVKRQLDGLKGNFEALQSFATKVFFGIAGAGVFAAKAFGDAEAESEGLRAALRSTFEQTVANQNGVNDYADALNAINGKTITTQVHQVIQRSVQGGAVSAPDATGQTIKLKYDGSNIDAAIDATMERLQKFASAMQQLTVYDDDAVLGVAKLAANLGVASKDLEQVTRTGIGLAQKFFGGDLQAGVEAAAKAYQGNTRALDRIIPGLKLAGSAQDKWNIIQRQGASGFAQAEARTRTFNGAMLQLWGQLGNVAEQIGGVLAPHLETLAAYVNAISQRFQNLSSEQTTQIVKWAAIAAGVAGVIAFGPKLFSFASGVTSVFVSMAKIGLTAVTALIQGMAKGIIFLVTTPFGLLLAGLAAIVAGIAYGIGAGDTFASRMIDGFMKIVSSLDVMLGSWAGFTQSLATVWHQAGFILLDTWIRVQNMLLNLWSDLKTYFANIWYEWADIIGVFGIQVWNQMKSLAENIRNAWNAMIDAIAHKMAGLLVRRQARIDVEENFKAGQQVDDKTINRMTVMGLGGSGTVDQQRARLQQQYGGRQLTAEDIEKLSGNLADQRANDLDRQSAAESARKEKEHQENLARIQRENDAAVQGIGRWARDGRDATNKGKAGDHAANDKSAAGGRAAVEEAQRKDLEADLKKLQGMPKLSDKVKQAYDMIRQGLGLDAVTQFVNGIKDEMNGIKGAADKAKTDAQSQYGTGKNTALGGFGQQMDGAKGKSIEDSFRENMTKTLVGAQRINSEEEQRKQEAAEKKRQHDEAMRNSKDNTQAQKDHTDALNKNTDALKNGNGQTTAVAG